MEGPTPPAVLDCVFGRLKSVKVKRLRPSLVPNSSNNSATTSSQLQQYSPAGERGIGSENSSGWWFGGGSSNNNQNKNSSDTAGGLSPASSSSSPSLFAVDDLSDSANWEVPPHINRLTAALQQDTINTAVAEDAPLRKELWHGAVEHPLLRAEAWRLCLGISPATVARRTRDALRQLNEYKDYLEVYYYDKQKQQQQQPTTTATKAEDANAAAAHLKLSIFPHIRAPVPPLETRTKTERDILNQLAIDLPRHKAALYKHPQIVERLRRCLFVWSLRNPAVAYVQGMDDVVVVLFLGFLDEAFAMLEVYQQQQQRQKNHVRTDSTSSVASSSSLAIPSSTTPTAPSTPTAAAAAGTATSLSSSSSSSIAAAVAAGNSHTNNSGTTTTAATMTAAKMIKSWLALRAERQCRGRPNSRLARPWTDDLEKLSEALAQLPAVALDLAECDTYNCGGRFLSWGMDRYTFGQPGVLACVDTISAGVKTFDQELFSYIRDVCGLEFRTFAYKYVHLLLVRDLGPWLSMRLFDTLLSAGASRCWEFFSYFCVAWLLSIRNKLVVETPPDEALMVLQEPSRIGVVSGSNAAFHREGRQAGRWMDEVLSQAYLYSLKKQQQASCAPPAPATAAVKKSAMMTMQSQQLQHQQGSGGGGSSPSSSNRSSAPPSPVGRNGNSPSIS